LLLAFLFSTIERFIKSTRDARTACQKHWLSAGRAKHLVATSGYYFAYYLNFVTSFYCGAPAP
jgi:hypothetical protein